MSDLNQLLNNAVKTNDHATVIQLFDKAASAGDLPGPSMVRAYLKAVARVKGAADARAAYMAIKPKLPVNRQINLFELLILDIANLAAKAGDADAVISHIESVAQWSKPTRTMTANKLLKAAQKTDGSTEGGNLLKNMPSKGRSKSSQEKSWSSIGTRMQSLINQFPQDNIASHMVRLRELDFTRSNPNAFYLRREELLEFGANIQALSGKTLQDPIFYPDVRAGEYTTSAISPMTYLLKSMPSDVTDIIEFGSGWGSNLFQLFVGMGATRSQKIRYHGAEYTDAGQEAAQILAGIDDAMDFRSYPFDYRKPDMNQFDFKGDRLFAFTRHSIEQVEIINPNLYKKLSNFKGKVTLIHLEPVGWQRDPELMAKRIASDEPYFQKISENIATAVQTRKQQQQNAAWWSWRLAYNVNLTEIIDTYEAEGKITKRQEVLDIAAVGNALNPTTLFHLDFNR